EVRHQVDVADPVLSSDIPSRTGTSVRIGINAVNHRIQRGRRENLPRTADLPSVSIFVANGRALLLFVADDRTESARGPLGRDAVGVVILRIETVRIVLETFAAEGVGRRDLQATEGRRLVHDRVAHAAVEVVAGRT